MTRKQKKRLQGILVAAILTVVVACVPASVYPSVLGFPLVRFLAFLIPYTIVGWNVLTTAVRNLINGRLLDECFLMAVATVGAFALGEYIEGVMVMLLYQVGELFQSIAVGRSRKNIALLMDIRPDTATVLRAGEPLTVSPDDVQVGETIRILPGEKIPLDGRVLTGESSINTAALTGESLPIDVGPGDRVISGSLNLQGAITVEVESNFSESTVSKILDLVENAAGRKAKAENFITRFARIYTPCVVGVALLLAILPPLFVGGWAIWIERALIFLVVSCPCALVISVPLSFFGGIGGASRQGILIKGAEYLEMLARTHTMVFDKTGTLTRGSFCVSDVFPVDGVQEEQLLTLAASAESQSTHPIALSVLAAVTGDIPQPDRVTEYAGQGIAATVGNAVVLVGNAKLMETHAIAYHPCARPGTVLYVAENGIYRGAILLLDEVKPEAKEAIAFLKKQGIRHTVMLTGDRREIGEAVCRGLAVDEAWCELLPGNKVEEIEKMLGTPSVAYVGDGINDAPVLSRADVGIAMGALGSDAAIEAADVILMDDNLAKLPAAIRHAKKTMRIVHENILFALGVKFAVLILAALGFSNMWVAIFADVGVMVLAILNAMRTMRIDK